MDSLTEATHDSECFLQEQKKSIVSSLLVLFGLTQILIGAVLPLGNSFSKAALEEEHENYMEVFFILQYTACIVCIIYLILIVHLDMRKKKKEQKLFEMNNAADDNVDNIDVSNKRYSHYENVNHTSIPQLNDQTDYPYDSDNDLNQMSTMNDIDDMSHTNAEDKDHKIRLRKLARKFSIPPHLNSAFKSNHFCDRIGLDAEGINLYLRMGAVAFGFGVLMHNALKFSDEVWTKGRCRGTLWIPNLVVHFFYIFIQTYFLFKYHKIIFNVKKLLIRFMLVQLMVTNICQWFKIVVFEITEELKHEAANLQGKHRLASNYTNISFITPNPTGRHLLGGGGGAAKKMAAGGNSTNICFLSPDLSGKMSKFLFPCAIEYSLISGAVFYKLYTKVGHLRRGELEEAKPHRMVTHPTYSTCHKSNKGFFFGLVLFLIVLGAVGLFFFLDSQADSGNGNHDLVMKIYMSTEMVLQTGALISTLVAFLQIRSLPYRKFTNRSDFDDKLLFVGLAGILTYDLFLFLPASESVPEYGWISAMFIVKSLVEIAGCLLQSLFVMDGNRRCSSTIEQLDKKPGRSAVMFLFITNLSMWLVNTFEVEKAETSQIHLDHYHPLTWNIVTHLLLPLIIFFRFHSTVCLSEIWSSTYKWKEVDDVSEDSIKSQEKLHKLVKK